MKTNVTETSIESIRQHETLGKVSAQELKIINVMAGCDHPVSRRDIFLKLNENVVDIDNQIGYGSVCGRVNSLVERGELIETSSKLNKTGRNAKLLFLQSEQYQIPF